MLWIMCRENIRTVVPWRAKAILVPEAFFNGCLLDCLNLFSAVLLSPQQLSK